MLPILISLASACSCIYYENVSDKLKNADYVFSGKVTDIKLVDAYSNQKMQEVTVRIINSWKPSAFPESVNLVIYSNIDSGANCGYNFEEDKEYLVYAYLDDETQKFMTNSCMGNLVLSKTDKEIKDLNELTQNTNNNPNNNNNTAEPIDSNIFTKFFNWLKSLFS